MTEEDQVPAPPDPPGQENSTAYKPPSKRRGDSRHSGTSVNTPSTPLPPPPSCQNQDCLQVSGLAEFKAGKARKRQATAGPEDCTRRPDPTYLGTPRSVRFKNIFSDTAVTPNLLDVMKKLYDLINSTIKLLEQGAERAMLGSESAADVKTLIARLLELAELQDKIPSFRRNLFLSEDDDHQIKQALAAPNIFGCKVPDVLEKKLDQMAKDLANIKKAASNPSGTFSFNTPTSNATRAPSYALTASKHARRPQTATNGAPQVFRPTLHKMAPPPPPPALKSSNTITLTQSDKEVKELTALNYPTLIAMINGKLTEANVKEKDTDQKVIQICSVHRHP